MSGLTPLLDAHELVPPLDENEAELAARDLAADSGLTIYARSIAAKDGHVYFLARRGAEKLLCIMAKDEPSEFEGDVAQCAHGVLKVCTRTHANAVALRATLPYTAPIRAGDRPTVGTGDRLGLATPGHIRAVRGTGVTPLLAQQSMREMARTLRSPENVMDDATWGVFEEGFRDGFGSDADHLKTAEDIDRTFAAGFRLFTIDPGEYVDNDAERDDLAALEAKFEKFPWSELETTAEKHRAEFAGKTFAVGLGMELGFTEEDALRAAVKYGRPVAHTARLYRHIEKLADGQAFEYRFDLEQGPLFDLSQLPGPKASNGTKRSHHAGLFLRKRVTNKSDQFITDRRAH